MMMEWIDIAGFALKYGVSQSTVRRRIRQKSIPFKLERGKYYLHDSNETLKKAPLFSRTHDTEQKVVVKSQALSGANLYELEALKNNNLQLKKEITKLNALTIKQKKQIDELQTLINILDDYQNENV